MRAVPESPHNFGDAPADVIGAERLAVERPPMRTTSLWVSLPFGIACWVVMAAVVYAAWTWL